MGQREAVQQHLPAHQKHRMTDDSAARIEAQDYYTMRFEKQRTFKLSGQPERRGKKRGNNWLRPWRENSQDWRYRRLGGSL